MSTLANIRTKVRRLTARPSPQQITDAQIDDYVNTFYLYDVPETLRLFDLSTTFEFMTIPNVSEYDLRTMDIAFGSGTETAANVFVNISPPVYIAGYESFWSQDREQFFRIYPNLSDMDSTILGDGTPGAYTASLIAFPIIQGSLTIGAIDDLGNNIQLVDVPVDRETGNLFVINTTTQVTGSINYLTGALTVTFNNNIPAGNDIFVTWVPYQDTRPQALLYYNDIITLRPIPDNFYKVVVNAQKTPTALIASGDSPELKQWWQYLAYGAAVKIFQDTQDPESLATVTPEFQHQETLVLRRTIVQQTLQRTATIYSELNNQPWGNFAGRF